MRSVPILIKAKNVTRVTGPDVLVEFRNLVRTPQHRDEFNVGESVHDIRLPRVPSINPEQ